MPAWRSILCAVDLSDASRAALRDAAQLARTCGAELTLLHVSTLVSGTDPFVPSVEELMRQDAKTLERELQPWKEEAARLAERPVTIAVVHGRPADEIVAFARDRGFDLVVVATHGRSGVRRLVLGSVAEHVVREAPVPVLVVRPLARR
jgi:nucleotide-binding universal stress UspA family protein